MKPRNHFLDHTIITFHDAIDMEKHITDERSSKHCPTYYQGLHFNREDYNHAAGDYEPLPKTNDDLQHEGTLVEFRRLYFDNQKVRLKV